MSKKNLLIWGYFVKNFGDDLMLKSFLKVSGDKYHKIYINSYKEYKKFYSTLGVISISQNSFIYRVINKIRVLIGMPELYYCLASKRKMDFVMLGGSLFAETDVRASEQQIKNLEYAVSHAECSYVIGSNFGPYVTDKFFKQYKNIFKRCKDVCFRDMHSYNLFSSAIAVRYAPDIILSGAWDDSIKTNRNNTVVISVINLEKRPTLKDKMSEYEQTLADIALYHLRNGEQVALVAFCESEGDVEVCKRIKNLCQKSEIEIFVYSDYSFQTIMAEAKKIYGSRFHSIILAMYYGIQCVPFVYNEKTYNAIMSYASSVETIDITKLSEYSAESIARICRTIDTMPNIKKMAKKQFEKI